MPNLSQSERELVALGAALGSNCVPCIEYHVPEARKAGLSDEQIHEAIRLADKVRQVPARKVLARALELVGVASEGARPERTGSEEPPVQKSGDPGRACCA
jgi:4-carboxymuconolactone decarboxylase